MQTRAIHTRTHTCTHICKHVCTHTYTRVHARTHARIYANTYTCTHSLWHSASFTPKHLCWRTCVSIQCRNNTCHNCASTQLKSLALSVCKTQAPYSRREWSTSKHNQIESNRIKTNQTRFTPIHTLYFEPPYWHHCNHFVQVAAYLVLVRLFHSLDVFSNPLACLQVTDHVPQGEVL